MKLIRVGLIRESREITGIENYIFNRDLDPLDFASMSKIAEEFVANNSNTTIHCSVTGDQEVTAALLSLVIACNKSNIRLYVSHYDKYSGEYLPRRVLS